MNLDNFDRASVVAAVILLTIGFCLGVLIFASPNTEDNSVVESIALILTPMFASIVGAGGAYIGIRRKQQIDEQNEKIRIINKAIFQIKYCIDDLCSIKEQYRFLFNNPSETRGTEIPIISRTMSRVNYDVSDLYFLADCDENNEKFIDLISLDASYRNFNMVIDIILNRNSMYEDFLSMSRSSKTSHIGGGILQGSIKDVKALYGEGRFDALLHLSEELIKTVDRTLKNLSAIFEQLTYRSASRIDKRLVPTPSIVHMKFNAYAVELISTQVIKVNSTVR